MTTAPNTKLELEFVSTFVVRPKRARYTGFLVSPGLRPKFLRALYGFSDFDPRFQVSLSGRADSSHGFLTELRRRGAGSNAYLISTNGDLDAVTMPLDAAVNEVHGYGDGTIIICTPAHLAYYEGEWRYRFILDSRLFVTTHNVHPLRCPVGSSSAYLRGRARAPCRARADVESGRLLE